MISLTVREPFVMRSVLYTRRELVNRHHHVDGDRRISVDAAIQLCNHFRITLDWIYRGELYGLPAEFVDYLRASQPNGKIHAA